MKKFLCFLALALGSLAAGATLTVADCVRLAVAHYPDVARYGLLEASAQYDLSNAAKAWLPQGSVAAQATWQNDVMALPDALSSMLSHQGIAYPGLKKEQYRIGVDVSQQVWDGGRVSASKQAIRSARDVERNKVDVQLYDVEGRVENLYFGILLLDERIARAAASEMLLDSTLVKMKSMFANGVAMRSDCDQIEARLLGVRQQRVQLTEVRASYIRMMELFIGEPVGDRRLQLPDGIDPYNGEIRNPQLRLFDSQLTDVSSQMRKVGASVMPSLGVFASGYYGYPGYNYFKSMQTGSMSFNFMVGVRMTWNFGALYTRGNTLDRLRMQRRQIEVARESYIFNNNILRTESSGRIDALRAMISDDLRIVELRRSVRNAAQAQLDNGIIDTTSLLSKITDEEVADNDLVAHRIELVQNLYQLNHLCCQ